MNTDNFHHAFRFVEEACIGCTHCISVCPTEALRIKQGKVDLLEERCIDCGHCFKKCPVNAIKIEQDDFKDIFHFKYRVAVFPAVLVGQFPEVTTEKIYNVFYELGFTHVIEGEQCVDILSEQMLNYVDTNNSIKPAISAFCPAVVRLIQVKFPSLVDNIILLKQPLDISAMYMKQQLMDAGADESEIGIFYITPCAAKIAAVKSPVGEKKSVINGVINMDFIYNKIRASLKQNEHKQVLVTERGHLSKKAILWTMTNGEAKYAKGRSLAIDEIHNVIEFLEKIENEEITDIDFLELRACDESCAGGVNISANRFLIVERLRNRAAKTKQDAIYHDNPEKCITRYSEYLENNMALAPIQPRSMMKLDEDMAEAMKKMSRVKEMMRWLPEVDCGACGSPTCLSLAEDIVQGRARIDQCIFVQRVRELSGVRTWLDSINVMEQIWGKEKFKRKGGLPL